jgi:hypothetical protein
LFPLNHWSFIMATLQSMTLAGALAITLAACAQTPATPGSADHAAHHPPGAASAAAAPAPTERMAMMDTHMKAMREMHEKMARARTPEERNALMAEHMKLMQEGMAMMGGMRGMGPMGAASAPADMAMRQQMMEKRMEMMQSMMQMMMDRMPAPSPAAK